jgi:tetratricopeptide (TPR) repeat protein
MAAWIIGGILSLTWVRSINHPRAAATAGAALKHIQQGDPQATLADLDRAIALAPDVPVYYNYRAQVYAIYRENDRLPPERECNQQKEVTYDVCLAQQVYFSNLAAVEQRPLYWRSRLALADSAFLLKQDDEAIRLYNEVLSLLPASWLVRNRLANAYISAGRPEEALKPLAESLAITGDIGDIESNRNPADALFLQAMAYRDLGKPEEAIRSLERSLALRLGVESAQEAQEMLGQIRSSLLSK